MISGVDMASGPDRTALAVFRGPSLVYVELADAIGDAIVAANNLSDVLRRLKRSRANAYERRKARHPWMYPTRRHRLKGATNTCEQ